MKASASDYAEALYGTVSERPQDRQALVEQFLAKLRLDGNKKLLPLIIDEMQSIEDKKEQILRVKVVTAVPLDDRQRQDIVRELTTASIKTVRLEEQVEPGIIGGIRIVSGDRIIDHTIKTKLEKLASRL